MTYAEIYDEKPKVDYNYGEMNSPYIKKWFDDKWYWPKSPPPHHMKNITTKYRSNPEEYTEWILCSECDPWTCGNNDKEEPDYQEIPHTFSR